MILDELLALPESGVVILRKGSSVLVSYTTSMGAELLELYTQFKGKSGYSIEVLSVGADIETLKLHTEYYRELYGATGHSRKALQYRVRIVPEVRMRWVDVQLVSARGDSKVVGRFQSIPEAKSFIETCYGSDNPFRFPVYACNQATKELLLEQAKLLKIRI